jgi:hypothetical protein
MTAADLDPAYQWTIAASFTMRGGVYYQMRGIREGAAPASAIVWERDPPPGPGIPALPARLAA